MDKRLIEYIGKHYTSIWNPNKRVAFKYGDDYIFKFNKKFYIIQIVHALKWNPITEVWDTVETCGSFKEVIKFSKNRVYVYED